MQKKIDGYWLPQEIRERVLTSNTEFDSATFSKGRPSIPEESESVTVTWPLLKLEQWKELLDLLKKNRQRAPTGTEFWKRFQKALDEVQRRFGIPTDLLRKQALNTLPSFTGYSEPMIRITLDAQDIMALNQLEMAFSYKPLKRVSKDWQAIQGLPGRIRFFSDKNWRPGMNILPGFRDQQFYGEKNIPELVLGYGSGNVPGTAMLIAFLSLATTLKTDHLPVVVVKNSRREPIFTPLVLSALQEVDSELVSTTAVLIWDYENSSEQEYLLSQSNLVLAAAGDGTIAQIKSRIDKVASNSQRPIRFHAHGHKVSFSAIDKEVLHKGAVEVGSDTALLEIVTLLSALDSIFWDQHGCLSSRIHFVETGGAGYYNALDYATQLETQLRLLGKVIPRGAWPRQLIHDRFDRYKSLETTGKVDVLTGYDDEFLVAVDRRALNPSTFQSLVNDCQGRVIIIRAVKDLMEIPDYYLKMLPRNNLQSLSVAVGRQAESLSEGFLHFAEECCAQGVTAIRSVGRGAFPQLSYSWDGYIPLDLLYTRPKGYFSTIEFDRPYDQMIETYNTMQQRSTEIDFFGRY
ncbi:acyl-CoA reductase [Chloroflexota bacterium]